MRLTEEIIEAGKSWRGGWSKRQLRLFGINKFPLVSGWKKMIVGMEVDKKKIDKFLYLKDKHLRKKELDRHRRDK